MSAKRTLPDPRFEGFSVNGRKVKHKDNTVTIFDEESASDIIILPCGIFIKGADGVFRNVANPLLILKFQP